MQEAAMDQADNDEIREEIDVDASDGSTTVTEGDKVKNEAWTLSNMSPGSDIP
jgi:hypothetical protein